MQAITNVLRCLGIGSAILIGYFVLAIAGTILSLEIESEMRGHPADRMAYDHPRPQLAPPLSRDAKND